MRKGIVAGEPGIFPWPVGRFFHWISRIGHRDEDQPAEPATDEPASGPDEGLTEPR